MHHCIKNSLHVKLFFGYKVHPDHSLYLDPADFLMLNLLKRYKGMFVQFMLITLHVDVDVHNHFIV